MGGGTTHVLVVLADFELTWCRIHHPVNFMMSCVTTVVLLLHHFNCRKKKKKKNMYDQGFGTDLFY